MACKKKYIYVNVFRQYDYVSNADDAPENK